MFASIIQAVGGLGLFLLGMIVMTEGLRSLAGDAMNRVLFKLTRSPLSGAMSGAAVTAVVQSSSATTVATVGLVSAGLLTFAQALGVLFGANIGTTITGWMVAFLGFKLSLGSVALPGLFLGVLLRLFGREKLKRAGWLLCGFSLVFFGIEQMQAGMEPLTDVVTPQSFPPDTLGGRLTLLLIGMIVTIVTQSSSAGVAAALTALHLGAISFPQAAVLVIGMDVGTTSTTAIATIGGSAQTKRTGFSHVIYNVITGVGALLILDPYMTVLEQLSGLARSEFGELSLVGFHTFFNMLGVALILPVTHQFAQLMYRLFPDRGPRWTAGLDAQLLSDPAAATNAIWATVSQLSRATFSHLALHLSNRQPSHERALQPLSSAVEEARRYANSIEALPLSDAVKERYQICIHCLDHLDRLLDRIEQFERFETAWHDPALAPHLGALVQVLEQTTGMTEPERREMTVAQAHKVRDDIRTLRSPYREQTVADVGNEIDLSQAIARLDAIRWLHRTSYHVWRIIHHLSRIEAAHPGTIASSTARELDPTEID